MTKKPKALLASDRARVNPSLSRLDFFFLFAVEGGDIDDDTIPHGSSKWFIPIVLSLSRLYFFHFASDGGVVVNDGAVGGPALLLWKVHGSVKMQCVAMSWSSTMVSWQGGGAGEGCRKSLL